MFLVVDQAESVIIAQRGDKVSQSVVGDSGAKLAVQCICGGLAKREAIDFLNGFGELGGLEEGAFDPLRVAFEALIGAETGTRRSAKLATHGHFLGHNEFDPFPNQGMVVVVPGQGRRVRYALGGAEDFELGLGDLVAILVHPSQRVVPLCGSEID